MLTSAFSYTSGCCGRGGEERGGEERGGEERGGEERGGERRDDTACDTSEVKAEDQEYIIK